MLRLQFYVGNNDWLFAYKCNVHILDKHELSPFQYNYIKKRSKQDSLMEPFLDTHLNFLSNYLFFSERRAGCDVIFIFHFQIMFILPQLVYVFPACHKPVSFLNHLYPQRNPEIWENEPYSIMLTLILSSINPLVRVLLFILIWTVFLHSVYWFDN